MIISRGWSICARTIYYPIPLIVARPISIRRPLHGCSSIGGTRGRIARCRDVMFAHARRATATNDDDLWMLYRDDSQKTEAPTRWLGYLYKMAVKLMIRGMMNDHRILHLIPGFFFKMYFLPRGGKKVLGFTFRAIMVFSNKIWKWIIQEIRRKHEKERGQGSEFMILLVSSVK